MLCQKYAFFLLRENHNALYNKFKQIRTCGINLESVIMKYTAFALSWFVRFEI